jgi:hypothetical protein
MQRVSIRISTLFAFLFLSIPVCVHASGDLFRFAHAHNDYEHPRPLLDALEAKCHSVEVDIWFVSGEILVSHDEGKYKGTLQELYLDPLYKLIQERGSVYGDQQPFYLWLDFKHSHPGLRPVLQEQLRHYPIFTTFTDEKTIPKPITVILTGNHSSKIAYTEEFQTRYACRDSNHYSPDDPVVDQRWQWYALDWKKYIRWDGNEEFPKEEKETLQRIVNDIHSKGKKVRFYATPETEAYWSVALNMGIDLINTDKLKSLNTFLTNQAKK